MTTTKASIDALRRRLEKWELAHLRQLAADLDERLERAGQEIERLKDVCSNAEVVAEFWRENAMELQRTFNDEHFSVGITKDGQMIAFQNESQIHG